MPKNRLHVIFDRFTAKIALVVLVIMSKAEQLAEYMAGKE